MFVDRMAEDTERDTETDREALCAAWLESAYVKLFSREAKVSRRATAGVDGETGDEQRETDSKTREPRLLQNAARHSTQRSGSTRPYV